jgi:hypothetical protein
MVSLPSGFPSQHSRQADEKACARGRATMAGAILVMKNFHTTSIEVSVTSAWTCTRHGAGHDIASHKRPIVSQGILKRKARSQGRWTWLGSGSSGFRRLGKSRERCSSEGSRESTCTSADTKLSSELQNHELTRSRSEAATVYGAASACRESKIKRRAVQDTVKVRTRGRCARSGLKSNECPDTVCTTQTSKSASPARASRLCTRRSLVPMGMVDQKTESSKTFFHVLQTRRACSNSAMLWGPTASW